MIAVSTLASPHFAISGLDVAVRGAIEAGLHAAAVLTAEGKALAIAGFDRDEARAFAAFVTNRMRTPDLLQRLLAGELPTWPLGDRDVSIGIAASCVFVVAVHGSDAAAARDAVYRFRNTVEQMVNEAKADVSVSLPPTSGSGGSSSGPAELPVIEIGVTVPRERKPN